MNFGSINFIFIFLPILCILYRIVPISMQKIFLAVSGFVFYLSGIWGEGNGYRTIYISCLICSLIVNYLLYDFNHKRHRKSLLGITIAINAVFLLFFKSVKMLPLGISFYTFQMIALQVDLYRSHIYLRGIDYLTYTMFFPRLVMGPIGRYSECRSDIRRLETRRGIDAQSLEEGLKLFTLGLSMKILLADRLATLWNSICVSGALGITTQVAWLGAIGYSLQLYFDFWGYSLMAKALGEILGITVPDNFDNPYCSRTVSEFWRRWHITLGKWFRDYIYIPMGGSRNGAFITVRNLFIVWLITGLWHGMGMNFIIWAGALLLLILIERFTPLGRIFSGKNVIGAICGHIYLIAVIPITWMIFAHTDFDQMSIYIKCMFGLYDRGASPARGQFTRYLSQYWYIFGLGILCASSLVQKLYLRFKNKKWMSAILLCLFWLSIYMLNKSQSNPFMYYSF